MEREHNKRKHKIVENESLRDDTSRESKAVFATKDPP